MISIILPRPPSTNGLFANKQSGGRIATEDYAAWRVEAGWLLKAARLKPIKGQVKISLSVEDTGRRDLSNAGLKSIDDLLVTHGLIEGDDRRFVRAISLAWSEGFAYYVVPGEYLEPSDAQKIIERPDVFVYDDGLFPGIPQSWRLRLAGDLQNAEAGK